MAVEYRVIPDTAQTFADNLCRWERRAAGHYEAWFLTLNQRATQHGFWFRYTIEAPVSSEPRAVLWAAMFDHKNPGANIGLKHEYHIDEFRFEGREAFNLQLGEGLFTPSHAVGKVDTGAHHIAWDLRFKPCEKTYHHVPPTLVRLARPASFVCSPNLDARFSGQIIVDGREHLLDDEPGCQSHLWGRKHVDEWVWVHANAFDKHPGTVFEGLAARPRRGGHRMPPIQSLFLRHRGEEHRFVRVRMAEQWQRNLGIGYWSFAASSTRLRIEGAAQCRLRDMLQVEYRDPDSEPLYCINSEVANLKIRLFRRVRGLRWRHVETISARSTAHLEHAARLTDESVRLAFE